jgi:hypothetical protein
MGGKCKSTEALARRAKATREWQISHPESTAAYCKEANLRNHHLSQQGFDDLLVKQEGLCPVCKKPLLVTYGSRSGETVSIDHDHLCCPGTFSCGKCIRGLLHLKCNAALGGFQDDPTICRNAAEYLEHSKVS